MSNKKSASKKSRKKKRDRTTIRRLLSQTHPDNWPMQEVSTLDDILADRSVNIDFTKEDLF